jgi:cleavage and polyadenylation specificity factor subunit 3
VAYSGDIHLRPQLLTPGAAPPEGPVDVLILEATLGADSEAEATTRRTEETRLADRLAEVLARGGSVLIPVFALGRAQEMLALVARFKERGRIPADTPVYTAGSMRAIAEIYDRTRLTTPRLDRDLVLADIPQLRLPRNDSVVAGLLAEPSIFILPSGMMFERTAANDLGQYLVDQEKHAIFLVGFSKEDAPAGRLLAAARQGEGAEVVLDPQTGPQAVGCAVERFRFSGHSHRRDLLGLVSRLQPKKVILVHAEPEAKTWMEDNIRHFHPDTEVIRPQQGEVIEV